MFYHNIDCQFTIKQLPKGTEIIQVWTGFKPATLPNPDTPCQRTGALTWHHKVKVSYRIQPWNFSVFFLTLQDGLLFIKCFTCALCFWVVQCRCILLAELLKNDFSRFHNLVCKASSSAKNSSANSFHVCSNLQNDTLLWSSKRHFHFSWNKISLFFFKENGGIK